MSMTKVNWYPGHMKKTKDLIKEYISLVDLILDVRDARVYNSSSNPDLTTLANNKNRIILLNKADLVEAKDLNRIEHEIVVKASNVKVLAISAEKGLNVRKLTAMLESYKAEKAERMLKKGLRKVSFRIMIVGIPNVGKSKLINVLAKRKAAGVGNKPGFTRGKQWITIDNGMELLDTPGVLWPDFENVDIGARLAIISAIREDILDRQELAQYFLMLAKERGFLDMIAKAYHCEFQDSDEIYTLVEKIATAQHMLLRGSDLDIEKASQKLLLDYRNLKFGKIPLE